MNGMFNIDCMVISPSWTTYRPQCLLAGKKPKILNTTFEGDWRITPEVVEQVMLYHEFYELNCRFKHNAQLADDGGII